MYSPASFREDDTATLHDLIDRHSFGTLIANGPDPLPDIAHLPFLLHRRRGPLGVLGVHVARANPIWRVIERGKPVVALFGGPHGYVSPTWYRDAERQVPTWNYAVVHAVGTVRGPMDREALVALLGDLMAKYEGEGAGSWTLGRMDAAVLDDLLPAIVGFEIEVTELRGKLKLSQNRDPEDRRRVIAALEHRGNPDDLAMVAMMKWV